MKGLPFKKDDDGLPSKKEEGGLPYKNRRAAQIEEEDEDGEEDEEDEEDLPDSLPPPPQAVSSGFPAMAFVLGLVASAVAGAALGMIGQFFYIYILASIAVALVVAKGMGIGIQQQKSTSRGALQAGAVIFSILAFVFFNLALYFIMRERIPEISRLDPFQFFVARAKFATFMGIPLGQIGMLIVWGLEAAFTAFLAVSMIDTEVNNVEMSMVPPDVLTFMLHTTGDGYTEGEIRDLLADRGWSRPEYQALAFRARDAAIAAVIAQQQA